MNVKPGRGMNEHGGGRGVVRVVKTNGKTINYYKHPRVLGMLISQDSCKDLRSFNQHVENSLDNYYSCISRKHLNLRFPTFLQNVYIYIYQG